MSSNKVFLDKCTIRGASVFQSASQLSVLPGVLLFLARLGSVTGGEGSGVACGLQVIEKFVPGGKFILTDHTAQVDFLL